MKAIFGYGSLCDISTLKLNNIYREVKTELGILHGYRVRTNKICKCGKHGYANVMESSDDNVYGVIIYLYDDEIERVDDREGVEDPDGTQYTKNNVGILTEKGIIETDMYVATPECTSEEDMMITPIYYGYLKQGLEYMKEKNSDLMDESHLDELKEYYKSRIGENV